MKFVGIQTYDHGRRLAQKYNREFKDVFSEVTKYDLSKELEIQDLKEPMSKYIKDKEDQEFIFKLLTESTTAAQPERFKEGTTKVIWSVYQSIMNIWSCFRAIDTDNDK